MDSPANDLTIQMRDGSILTSCQFESNGIFDIITYLGSNNFNNFARDTLPAKFCGDGAFGELLGPLARLAPGTSKFLVINCTLLLQTKENSVGNIFCNTTLLQMGEELAPTLCSRCERDKRNRLSYGVGVGAFINL